MYLFKKFVVCLCACLLPYACAQTVTMNNRSDGAVSEVAVPLDAVVPPTMRCVMTPVTSSFGGLGLRASNGFVDAPRRRLIVASDRGTDLWSVALPNGPAEQLTERTPTTGWMVYYITLSDPARERLIRLSYTYGLDSIAAEILDLRGPLRWTPVPVEEDSSPRARGVLAATYDPAGDRVILTFALDRVDVLTLSLGPSPEWSQLQASGAPSPTRPGGLVWDNSSGVSSTPKPRNFDGPRQKFA
jgi:hypothetical protein